MARSGRRRDGAEGSGWLAVFVDFVLAVCTLFSLRRGLWVLASWLPRRTVPAAVELPRVLLSIPFRNEAPEFPELLAALAALDYPRDRLRISLIDDASTDAGNEIVRQWVAKNPHAILVTLAENVGKADALNRSMADAIAQEILVVFDADVRPSPDCLKKLMAPFADPAVLAVSGYTRPLIAASSIVSAYAALESWTHQLVNLAAKDRLNLKPPTGGGNCAYRIAALRRVGGFPSAALSEDTAASIALANSGGVLRFVADATCEHLETDSLRFYLNQRLRWSYGLAAVIGQSRGVESVFVSLGYADRIVALVVASLAITGSIRFSWILLIAAPVAAAIGTAIAKARPTAGELFLIAAGFPFMAAVDVGISMAALANNIFRRRPTWANRTFGGVPSK